MAQVSAVLLGETTVQISNDRHEWRADEPPGVGGTDSAPNPYEMLLGSLAACTCITISMYCRHKGLQLDAVRATYDYAREHAQDSQNCDDKESGFIEKITSKVDIEGNFDEAQKKRLAQIVQRCPVHKTLANGVCLEDITSVSGNVQ